MPEWRAREEFHDFTAMDYPMAVWRQRITKLALRASSKVLHSAIEWSRWLVS
jgi:hypothetical protein